MEREWIEKARKGKSILIGDVRKAYSRLEKHRAWPISLVLHLPGNQKRLFQIQIPKRSSFQRDEFLFLQNYIHAEIYNLLSCLGGKAMDLCIDTGDPALLQLLRDLNEAFEVNRKRHERVGYGKCLNVIERVNEALAPGVKSKFQFRIRNQKGMQNIVEVYTSNREKSFFKDLSGQLRGKSIAGMDIGGTSVKLSLVDDGKIICLKNYHWFPARFTKMDELMRPILLLARLLRAYLTTVKSNDSSEKRKRLQELLETALRQDLPGDDLTRIVREVENYFPIMARLDGIGIGFPDVVARNMIVGGEVYKFRGIRESCGSRYDEELLKIRDLHSALMSFCHPGGQVRIINDGNMAAFTAALELTAASDQECRSGIFTHTLGTELGTGWVDDSGRVPEYPLECYNMIIDLGNFPARSYAPDDPRSNRNFNTNIPGTVQKYIGQSGVFRLALERFAVYRPDLYKELFQRGFLLQQGAKIAVNDRPRDMRSALMHHIVTLTEQLKDEVTGGIFEEIGNDLALLYEETQRIFRSSPSKRVLFGGLIANPYCVKLVLEGAKKRLQDFDVQVANGLLANTPLMKQLSENSGFSVSQFAQAIGAVYYALTPGAATPDVTAGDMPAALSLPVHPLNEKLL